MERLKSLKFVLIVLLIIATLVIVKTCERNGFTGDAQLAVNAMVNVENTVSENDYKQNKSEYFVLELIEKEVPSTLQFENAKGVVFENLLEESSLQSLKGKKVLLVSENPALATKAWIILNQFNIENVFLLNKEENPEVFKYEFQPDTSSKLESVSENN